MEKQLKSKLLLIFIFISYLVIVFTPRMPCNMIVIGFNEFDTLSNLNSVKYYDSFWIIGLVLILCGQISLIYSIIINEYRLIRIYSLIGLMFLIVALFVVGIKNTFDFGNIWWVTILTSSLFWSLTIYYLYKTLKNKTLPPTGRQPKQC